MPYDPTRHNRQSIRLKGYDYSQPGAYFVTICTQDRANLFGEIVEGEMRLNEAGQVAEACWLAIPDHFPHMALDAFVVMPNHLHGIIWILETGGFGARHAVPQTNPYTIEKFGKPVPGSIPTIVRSFKSAVTRQINLLRRTPGASVWQRNYYEHIVRDDRSLDRVREYILNNARQWQEDRNNSNS